MNDTISEQILSKHRVEGYFVNLRNLPLVFRDTANYDDIETRAFADDQQDWAGCIHYI